MTALDRASLFYKVEKIRSGLRILRRLAKLSYRDYARDIEHKMTAERLLQVGIEAMLDTGTTLLRQKDFRPPLLIGMFLRS